MSQPPTTFQTFSRLTIMLGTLAVGSMAAYYYRPEPEELADMIDHVASMVMEAPGDSATEGPSVSSLEMVPVAKAESFAAAPAMWDQPTATPRYDAAVQPAAALVPIAEAASAPGELEHLERERLTAPLLSVGATRADVTAWGRGDATVYRATASAPVSGEATGLERRFDAIGATPEEAVEALVAEIRTAVIR